MTKDVMDGTHNALGQIVPGSPADGTTDDAETTSEAETAIIEAVTRRVKARFQGVEVTLTPDDIEEIADRMVEALPDPATDALDAAVGPFYDTVGMVAWTGVSRQALHKRIGKSLLALRTAEDDLLYPSFQFNALGEVIPYLMDAADVLSGGLSSPWSVAMWLNTRVEDLGGRSMVECLKAGDVEAAMNFAHAEVERLNS